ncbi:unnamed protein product [Cylicocyclus nassatus]|uniref:Uncharacterized protein n=1 Tax=Cylicocyclus nassatus TaxID=53992 RepID=A0AA36GQY3_CYLNA|nr:unnamed protein product [Cylicocyclus nassatus]
MVIEWSFLFLLVPPLVSVLLAICTLRKIRGGCTVSLPKDMMRSIKDMDLSSLVKEGVTILTAVLPLMVANSSKLKQILKTAIPLLSALLLLALEQDSQSQYFFDIATSAESMQIINVSAGGNEVIRRSGPCIYTSVDPLGLSYDDDDPLTVDPRDQLNPGLVRITNGEDLFTNVSDLTDEEQKGMYNAMMLDPRWFKWSLQSGMRRTAAPLYWQVGQLHQDVFPGATTNVPDLGTNGKTVPPGIDKEVHFEYASTVGQHNNFVHQTELGKSDPRGFFQIGHKGRMGYIPTDAYAQYADVEGIKDFPMINPVPEVQCFTIVLPKAEKTVYYYRAYVTETVFFTGLRTVGVSMGDFSIKRNYVGIDQFIRPRIVAAEPKWAEPVTEPKRNDGSDV